MDKVFLKRIIHAVMYIHLNIICVPCDPPFPVPYLALSTGITCGLNVYCFYAGCHNFYEFICVLLYLEDNASMEPLLFPILTVFSSTLLYSFLLELKKKKS